MSGPLFEKFFGSELLFFGVGVGRVFFCAVLPVFLLYYLVFRSRKCLKKFLMSGLVFLGFLDWLSGVFRGDFSGPEMAHFCCPKTACEKFSLSLFFFGVLFCYAVEFCKVLGHELRFSFWRCSWLVLGVRFYMDFVSDTGSSFRRFWVPPVLLCSFSPSLPSSSSSSSSSGGMA